MAYTVTYKRRTQTGKMTTVKRRVEGNRPSPSPGTTIPRAKKPAAKAARKGQITSAKRPSAGKQFKASAPQKKSPTMSRGNAFRITATILGSDLKRQANDVQKEVGRAAKRVVGGVTGAVKRNKGSWNLAYGNASFLMQLEQGVRKDMGKTPTGAEVLGRSGLTLAGRRFSNAEQAVIVATSASSMNRTKFAVLLNRDIAAKMKRGKRSDPFNMALLNG